MKKFILLFISINLILAATTLNAGEMPGSGQKLYTSHNIWIWPSHNLKCINYKGARTKIDVGTEVMNVSKIQTSPYNENENNNDIERISFQLTGSGKIYTMGFVQRYHPGKSIKDYMENMVTIKNFDALTDGMSLSEKTAIKTGIIVDGMSKEAVLASYGPPPEHATPSIDNNKWKYWTNKREIKMVYFDNNNKTFNTGYPLTIDRQAATNPASLEDKLLQLKHLLDKGIITSQEYTDKRADLLKKY